MPRSFDPGHKNKCSKIPFRGIKLSIGRIGLQMLDLIFDAVTSRPIILYTNT